MNWFRLLFQLHCGQGYSEDVLEHFQDYEQDIINLVGYPSYMRYREQYMAVLHAKYKPTMITSTNGLTVGTTDPRMVSP